MRRAVSDGLVAECDRRGGLCWAHPTFAFRDLADRVPGLGPKFGAPVLHPRRRIRLGRLKGETGVQVEIHRLDTIAKVTKISFGLLWFLHPQFVPVQRSGVVRGFPDGRGPVTKFSWMREEVAPEFPLENRVPHHEVVLPIVILCGTHGHPWGQPASCAARRRGLVGAGVRTAVRKSAVPGVRTVRRLVGTRCAASLVAIDGPRCCALARIRAPVTTVHIWVTIVALWAEHVRDVLPPAACPIFAWIAVGQGATKLLPRAAMVRISWAGRTHDRERGRKDRGTDDQGETDPARGARPDRSSTRHHPRASKPLSSSWRCPPPEGRRFEIQVGSRLKWDPSRSHLGAVSRQVPPAQLCRWRQGPTLATLLSPILLFVLQCYAYFVVCGTVCADLPSSCG